MENIRDSMDKMEGKTGNFETVNLNNKKLLNLLEKVIKQLDLPYTHQQALMEADFRYHVVKSFFVLGIVQIMDHLNNGHLCVFYLNVVSSNGLGFLNPTLRKRRSDVTAFCMQLGNREDRLKNLWEEGEQSYYDAWSILATGHVNKSVIWMLGLITQLGIIWKSD